MNGVCPYCGEALQFEPQQPAHCHKCGTVFAAKPPKKKPVTNWRFFWMQAGLIALMCVCGSLTVYLLGK